MTHSFAGQMGDHKVPLAINLEPSLVSEQSDDPGHRYTGGAQSTGHLLMGQAQIETQSLLTGLAVILSKQLQETSDTLLNTTQTKQREQIFRLPMTKHNRSQQIVGEVL